MIERLTIFCSRPVAAAMQRSQKHWPTLALIQESTERITVDVVISDLPLMLVPS